MEPNIEYRVVYRRIKYPRLEFKTGMLTLILPEETDPKEILERHMNWILEKANFINKTLEESKNVILHERGIEDLKRLIESLVDEYSHELGVSIKKIFFRRMKTKWASCSPKRNLTINTLMRYLPDDLIRYIVFHEMVHLIERRHNERFWRLISSKFSKYEEMEKNLFVYWFLIHKITKL